MPGNTEIDSNSADNMATQKRPIVMPDAFAGSKEEDFDSWISYFENCADINGWTAEIKCKFIAVRLRGTALKTYQSLPQDAKADYVALKKALKSKFIPVEKLSLYKAELKARHQGKAESITDFGQSIRILAQRAYPSVSAALQDELSKDQFMDGIRNKEIRMKVKEGSPSTLDQAITRALELDALSEAESHRGVRSDAHQVRAVSDAPAASESPDSNQKLLLEIVNLLKNRTDQNTNSTRSSGRPIKVKCFYCKKLGHYKKDCFKLKQKLEAEKAASVTAPGQQGN